MSYRDDHDAALARIDALEGELARWHAAEDGEDEARRELARLEAEIKKLRSERARFDRGAEARRARRGLVAILLGGVGVAATVAVCYAALSRSHAAAPPAAPAPAPKAAPVAARTPEPPSHLIDCVAHLDAAIAAKASIGSDCMLEIARQAVDPSLGPDVHRVLIDWMRAEQGVIDTGDRTPRDELAMTIHAVVRPEFTR